MTDTGDRTGRILAAIANSDHPRVDLLGSLAELTLRRAPDHVLDRSTTAVVELLTGLLDRLTSRRPGSLELSIDVPSDGSDPVLEVIWEDRPFLLSTVTSTLLSTGYTIRGTFHPILGVELGDDGTVERLTPARPASLRVSAIRIDLTPPGDEGRTDDGSAAAEGWTDRLLSELRAALADVDTVTGDHAAMRTEVESAVAALATQVTSDAEVGALLSWLLDDNLILLGLESSRPPNGGTAPTTSLGLLRDPERREELVTRLDTAPYSDDVPRLAVSRTRIRASVQRHAPMEVIDVRLPGEDGDGRLVLLGLLTRKGVAEPVRTTPVLRRRLQRVLESEDIVEGSFDALTVTGLAHAIPKDELLRSDPDSFREILVELIQAEQHQEVVACTRPHRPSGTVSVLVALPRERWQPELSRRLRELLRQRFGALDVEVDASIDLQRDAVARYLLQLPAPDEPETWSALVPTAADGLTAAVAALARPWEETVEEELTRLGEEHPAVLGRSIVGRLPRSYRDATVPADAVDDVRLLARVLDGEENLLASLRPARSEALDDDDPAVAAATPPGTAPIRLIAAKRGATLELSAFLPILESLGLTIVDEFPHPLNGGSGTPATLHDFGVRAEGLDAVTDGPRVAEAILAAWHDHLEVDPLNRLIVVAGLGWRDIGLLRAYRRLRRQLGTAYTPSYVDTILISHPDTVKGLIDHFKARFDPDRPRGAPDESVTRAHVLAALDRLERLDHDRILRRLLELIDATLRTNAFRPDAVADGTGEPYLALKYDPSKVSDAPRPRPYREIFVHSPRLEGVHLRSGPVSRGGLRWSDRRDDVRSEVLDLVKAQVLKNTVIVPSGAKGGFVLTREPGDATAAAAEAHRQYITFIRGLLDVTDDLDGDRVVPPPNVVRHDGDDPYLVVAADRGTATFSDTANAVARRYGFWLDDAFASGGRHGYDHKRYGVTARGTWVAVTHHFRELGLDVGSDPIRVVGIGDMSGDVFGNGLRRSRAVRLVAAFDHRHIFLDPSPDPAASFDERERLYDLPGSSWDDYDRELLGPGGMIVARSAKRVTLNDPIRELLRVDVEELTPPELIRAVLRAPVDLLFAGGIGTYIRASTEPETAIGDRANADVRVEASTVRARVIGEGANLAITQRARIELARRGTLVNQDAIDNAAGVATSDQEVNLKILLRLAEDRGELTREQRDVLLEELADEVVEVALGVVGASCAALSREADRSPRSTEAYDRLLDRLTEEAGLDRASEVLPSSEELRDRAVAGAGLSRPELATVQAWSKRLLKEALLASDVPDGALCRPALSRSLPAGAVQRFGHLLDDHRLRRELITTVVVNTIVDRLGVTVVTRLADESAAPLPEVVRTLQAAIELVDAQRWWDRLDGLHDGHDPARLRELELPLEELVVTLARVLLTDPTAQDPELAARGQRPMVEQLVAHLDQLGTRNQRRGRSAHLRWLLDDLVEPDLARLLAGARDLSLVPDIAAVSDALDDPPNVEVVADALLQLSERLGIDRLEELLRRVDGTGGWARRERLGLAMDLRRARRAAATAALSEPAGARDPDAVPTSSDGQPDPRVERFLTRRSTHLEHLRATLTAAETSDPISLDALGVAARAVRETIERQPPVSDAQPTG